MEMKDYLASTMMWDPSQDDRQVISTFLTAYVPFPSGQR